MSSKKLLTEKQAENIRRIADTDPQEALKELRAVVAVRSGIAKARKFSIDAIRSTPKRRTPKSHTMSMDDELSSDYDRKTMIATARDIIINMSFGSGIIRQHVKNMIGSGPRLQATTTDDEFNKRVEEYWNKRRDLIDVRGMPHATSLRVGESREIVDGDYGLMIVKNGQTQSIEADRIANPPNEKKVRGRKYIGGVEMSREGVPIAYHIYNRGSRIGQMKYAGRAEARNFIHPFRPERFDQARGFPWILSAVNDLQDLRETLEAAKGKWKIENMLGVAIESEMPESDELASLWGGLTSYDETDMDGNDEPRYEVKLGQGVHSFDLRPGEKVKTIQSTTPNNTFEAMTMLMIRMISLTLDMPIEIALQYFTRGGYSAHRAAFLQYHESAKLRRSEIEKNRLDREYGWVISRALKSKKIQKPKASVKDPTAHEWQWPGLGILDPDKQRRGDKEGYKLGVESLSSITGRDGRYWQDMVMQRIREVSWIEDQARKAGVNPDRVLPAVSSPGEQPVGGGHDVREVQED